MQVNGFFNRVATIPTVPTKHPRRVATGLVAIILAISASITVAELKPEPIPNVKSIATPYPATYAVVQDFAFSGLIDSKFSLVDTHSQRFMGMMSAGQFATIDFSVPRQKFYVGETVHSRGARGTREDLITVYDFENLGIVAEIELPPKRMNVVTKKSSTAITDDDKFLLVFNMNPATSVTVIDLDSEQVVGEIQTPGCTLLYPDNARGFFTLCGNGGLVHITLDDQGNESNRWSSETFNDIDNDPLSEKAERIGDTWYLITYKGEVQPIHVDGKHPRIGERWWLANKAERDNNWRPAAWHGKATHQNGQLWVAMTPNGYNGSHKDPASHVWQYDVATQKRTNTTELKTPGVSIAVSQGTADDPPRLLVVNIEAALDIYEAQTGQYMHSITALGDTPYMVHAID